MAGKFASTCAKATAVVFTAIVAPVLVHNATKNDKSHDTAAGQPAVRAEEPARTVPERETATPPRPSPRLPEPPVPPAAPVPPAVAQVVVTGVGKTPEEALRDAFNTALYRAAAAQVGVETWAAHARELWDGLGADGGDLIRNWKDLGAKKEWTLRGTVHHRGVAVDVDRALLVRRLHAVPIPNPLRRGP